MRPHWRFTRHRKCIDVEIWVDDWHTHATIYPDGTRGQADQLATQWADAELHRIWHEYWTLCRVHHAPACPRITELVDNMPDEDLPTKLTLLRMEPLRYSPDTE